MTIILKKGHRVKVKSGAAGPCFGGCRKHSCSLAGEQLAWDKRGMEREKRIDPGTREAIEFNR
jgi:hypothetical protein